MSGVCVSQLQVKRIMNRYFELSSPIAKYAYVGPAAHSKIGTESELRCALSHWLLL